VARSASAGFLWRRFIQPGRRGERLRWRDGFNGLADIHCEDRCVRLVRFMLLHCGGCVVRHVWRLDGGSHAKRRLRLCDAGRALLAQGFTCRAQLQLQCGAPGQTLRAVARNQRLALGALGGLCWGFYDVTHENVPFRPCHAADRSGPRRRRGDGAAVRAPGPCQRRANYAAEATTSVVRPTASA
jgi:hypothetical protein